MIIFARIRSFFTTFCKKLSKTYNLSIIIKITASRKPNQAIKIPELGFGVKTSESRIRIFIFAQNSN